MNTTTLDEDLRALLTTLDDREEADALASLCALVTEMDWEPESDEGYTPFVYPH